MKRTQKEELDLKFGLEVVKHWEAHRRAFERDAAFKLLRRKAILLIGLGCFVVALILHPYISSLGAIFALLARGRS